MADDIRQDPGYKQAKKKMFGLHFDSIVLAFVAVAALGVAFSTAGLGLSIAAAIIGGISGYLALDAAIDEKAIMADVTAHRTTQQLVSVAQQQRATAIANAMGPDGNPDAANATFRATEAQRLALAASQGATRNA